MKPVFKEMGSLQMDYQRTVPSACNHIPEILGENVYHVTGDVNSLGSVAQCKWEL